MNDIAELSLKEIKNNKLINCEFRDESYTDYYRCAITGEECIGITCEELLDIIN